MSFSWWLKDVKELLVIRPSNTFRNINAKQMLVIMIIVIITEAGINFAASLLIIPPKMWAVGMHSVLRLWIADITAKTVYIETVGISFRSLLQKPSCLPMSWALNWT